MPEDLTPTTTPIAWVRADLLGDWANYHAGTPAAAFRKVGDHVELLGALAFGRKGSVMFTLPEGYRPPGLVVRTVAVAGAVGQAVLHIDRRGAVVVVADCWAAAAFIDLGGTTFLVDEAMAGEIVDETESVAAERAAAKARAEANAIEARRAASVRPSW